MKINFQFSVKDAVRFVDCMDQAIADNIDCTDAQMALLAFVRNVVNNALEETEDRADKAAASALHEELTEADIDLDSDDMDMARNGNPLGAIKHLRSRYPGLSLTIARRKVDAYRAAVNAGSAS